MTYKKLADSLALYFGCEWATLPEDQQQAWHVALALVGGDPASDGTFWDARESAGRQEIVALFDQQHDPDKAQENEAWARYYWAIHEKKKEIAEAELLIHGGDPLKHQVRHDILTRLRAELDALRPASSVESDSTLPNVENVAKYIDKKIDSPAWYDIEKERGCRRLILENWSTIVSTCGPAANGRQVLRQLKIILGKDADLPVQKTVQNRLKDLRNEKLIP